GTSRFGNDGDISPPVVETGFCSLILFYSLRCPTLITGVESHSVGTIYLMNLFSAFTSEVFRPLATILIPGAIGISTWVIALMWRFEELKTLVTNNHTEASLIMLLAMIFAGMVFEDFGSRWEGWLDAREDKKNDGKHMVQWYAYLRTS